MLIFCGFMALGSVMLYPKTSDPEGGLSNPNARGFYGEPKNSIDLVVMGNSNAYSAYSPMLMWKKYGIPSYVVAEGAQNIAETVNILEELLTCQKPKLIILDEPETGLDFHNQILVLNMVEKLAHEDGISAIMNTHYPTNAMSVADEAFMMNHKGTFFYGSTEKVLTEKNISVSFDVNVVVNEFSHHQKKIKSIVPVSLTDKAM